MRRALLLLALASLACAETWNCLQLQTAGPALNPSSLSTVCSGLSLGGPFTQSAIYTLSLWNQQIHTIQSTTSQTISGTGNCTMTGSVYKNVAPIFGTPSVQVLSGKAYWSVPVSSFDPVMQWVLGIYVDYGSQAKAAVALPSPPASFDTPACTCSVNDCDNAARGTSCSTTCSRCPCNNPQCVLPNIKANFCTYPGAGCPDAAQYNPGTTGNGMACCFFVGGGPGGSSPILIDWDDAGYRLTDAAAGVSFDFYFSGRPVQIAWTAPRSTNAFLVLDRDGDGLITSGKELFGSMSAQPPSADANGFRALALLDDNHDGWIDVRDAVYPLLRLWIDSNHNGISEPPEMHTPAELGVRAMELHYQEHRWRDAHGNQFRYRARILSDAGEKWAYDVILASQ
jgi:hypothetical protein